VVEFGLFNCKSCMSTYFIFSKAFMLRCVDVRQLLLSEDLLLGWLTCCLMECVVLLLDVC